jgi:hypothetical protein
MYSLALIIFVVSEKNAFEHFPKGSNVNLCPAMAAILDFREPYGKNVSKCFFSETTGQLKPNCPGMIIGRSSTKFLFFYADRKSKMAAKFHIGTKNLEIVEDRPMNIHVQFGFNHICSF